MSGATRLVPQRRSGFTLFEAVVALLIVGLVAVASLASVGTQLRVTDQSRHVTEASVLAEERLSQAEVLSATDLQSLPSDIAGGRFAAPFDTYTWRMTSVPNRNVDGVNDVTVSVDWPNGSYTLASRVYRAVPLGTGNSLSQPGFGGGSGGGGGGIIQLGGGINIGGLGLGGGQ